MVYLRYLIMANKPRIRFRGFTEDWEQRKLGDLAEIVRGASPRPISDSKWFDNNSDVGWLRISDVTAQDGRIQYLEQKISKLGQDKTRVVKTPHLLLSIAATVGKPVINYVPTGVHDGFLIFLNPKFNILYAFWWLEIFREEWNKYGQPGSQVNLNSDLVKNQVINIPNEKEQEKISSFLEALDRIITLHQCKLKKLNLAKKSLLQKLFPRNGSQIPGVRFKGFTDAWEQRKLCQITTRVTRKNGDQSDLPLTISAQDGLVDQRKYFNRQVASRDMSNYYLIKKGEFAYNKSYSEGYPFGAVKRLDYYDIGALSTLYILFEITDNNISSDFIVSYYMTHLWYKEISKRAAEGARNHGLLNISTEDFFDSELNIPNSIEEQVKIGNFIKQFDKFITLHQRKLERLQEVKKGLLQKMFV